ncbi:MAG: hypothetical protein B7X04_02145 [Parcubacteria group bacterium 21-54-25]|nr:MAG: hypothetical protein B7X04_02145 [Parcubacteria group bacterium 21-54-25]HQU07848.1 triose-phosphate isomerase [Candidatus Paceibacterota bacterium]
MKGMIIAANWKTYVESTARAKKLLASAKRLAVHAKQDVVLAPPAPFLGMLAAGNRSKVAFAVQDVSTETGGAHTGAVTAAAAREAGATHAIVGHSERRAAGDDNATVALKLQHILAQGMVPILCIGEHTRDDQARYLTFLREEIASAFGPLSQKERATIIIAYEPIWAIGKTAADSISPNDLTEMILYIRKALAEFLLGENVATARVLYGGSVEPGNARELAEGSGIDGFLVGHAATDVASFTALVKAVSTR